MDRFASPKLPKGRGVWLSDIVDSGAVGHSKIIPDGCADKGLSQSPGYTPVRERPQTSTPGSDVNTIHHLTDMVEQLGVQIGESIVAKLM